MKFKSKTLEHLAIGASGLVTVVLLLYLFLLLLPPGWAVVAFAGALTGAGFFLGRIRYVLKKQIIDASIWLLAGIVVFTIIGIVVAVIASLAIGGGGVISWEFLTAFPRNGFRDGGIFPAIVGTAMLVILMSIAGVPVGTITAIYLAEFARETSFLARSIRFAVNTLAGVPAIVFGLFGLGLFIGTIGKQIDTWNAEQKYEEYVSVLSSEASPLAGGAEAAPAEIADFLSRDGAEDVTAPVARLRSLGASNPAIKLDIKRTIGFLKSTERPQWGQPSLFWAALTMALLTLPVVIISVEEAIRSVPRDLREASYALGASRIETIFRVILPSSITGILTGAILAVSRGAGEVAPILFTGAAYYMPDLPASVNSQFMELGYHIYVLTTQSTSAELTRPLQFATTLVLLLLTFSLNLAAIVMRSRIRARQEKYSI